MLTIQESLKLAAPQPRDGFQAQLAQRLLNEYARRERTIRRILPLRFRSARAAIVLLAVLTIGVGVVLAISTVLQQYIRQDAGLKAIYEQGLGHEFDISQTIDGYTVTLEWAYADGNRLTLAYMIQGHQGSQYTNLESNVYALTLRDTGIEIPFFEGRSALIDRSGDMVDDGVAPTADRSLVLRTYDLSPIEYGNWFALDLRLEVDVVSITLQQRTLTPLEELYAIGPEEHFVFDFSVPLVSQQRVLNTPVSATTQNVTLTLRRVIVSPSQARVAVCFTPPAPDRTWTSIPWLTADGNEVAGGGAVHPVSGIGEAAGETCDEFVYNAGMFDYRGDWRLEITELVGFGSGGGNDQQRIAGSWVFEFTVP